MTEEEVAILENDAVQAVRRAFDAIEEVACRRMNRDEARELFDQSLTAHDLAVTARAALPSSVVIGGRPRPRTPVSECPRWNGRRNRATASARADRAGGRRHAHERR